jgi:dienelactone hydrolase
METLRSSTLLTLLVAVLASAGFLARAQDITPAKVTRVLPPPGIVLPGEQRRQLADETQALQHRLREYAARQQAPKPQPDDLADVGIYAKAVDFALRHGEFYQPRDVETASKLLLVGRDRLDALTNGQRPWATARGLVVRGYQSRLDDSYQPYGLMIPEQLDLSKPVPLYVWLHGRGDKMTDLNFMQQRQTSRGQIAPQGAIVVHPFGRYCNAFKFAGEVDVFEAIEAVQRNYKIDADRIVLWGFSMGGAGTWHLAAHYPDRWCAASPGAGFAETRRYQNIQDKELPPSYVQSLWHLYDVPSYTRNLFNLPVVAYSGENDKQIQAARIMEESFAEHGHTLPHIIGPGMGHAYHPKSLEELGKLMADAARKGIDRHPRAISLQTRTLRYNRCHWVELLGLEKHWEDSRVDATAGDANDLVLRTKNVTALRLSVPWRDRKTFGAGVRIKIDDRDVSLPAEAAERSLLMFAKDDRAWQFAHRYAPDNSLRKGHGLQGPMDDAFMEPFLVISPEPPLPGASSTAASDWWLSEYRHFRDRWASVFRGSPRFAGDDAARYDSKDHLVLWGLPASNRLLAQLLKHRKYPLPIQWDAERLVVNGKTYDAKTHVLAMIYPNPLNPKKYVVINSGPTFRQGHDRTNSQQTPKLPDWAVIDVRTPADAHQPGQIVDAGFFDENWQFRK